MLKNKRGLASRRSRGQSTLEYLVLVTAVVAALLVFLPGAFQKAFNETLKSGTNGMETIANRLTTARPLSP